MKQVEAAIFFGDDQIKDIQYELLKQGVLACADDLKAKVSQIKQEMRAPAFGHLAGIKENACTLADNIFKKERWFVLEAAPGTAFVTSDCPVLTLNLNLAGKTITLGSGFDYSNTAVVLPLSPTRLFLAGPRAMSWNGNVLNEHDMVAFNTSIVRFASRSVYALDKSAEIQSLVNSEMNRVIFGRNAFVPLETKKE